MIVFLLGGGVVVSLFVCVLVFSDQFDCVCCMCMLHTFVVSLVCLFLFGLGFLCFLVRCLY